MEELACFFAASEEKPSIEWAMETELPCHPYRGPFHTKVGGSLQCHSHAASVVQAEGFGFWSYQFVKFQKD